MSLFKALEEAGAVRNYGPVLTESAIRAAELVYTCIYLNSGVSAGDLRKLAATGVAWPALCSVLDNHGFTRRLELRFVLPRPVMRLVRREGEWSFLAGTDFHQAYVWRLHDPAKHKQIHYRVLQAFRWGARELPRVVWESLPASAREIGRIA